MNKLIEDKILDSNELSESEKVQRLEIVKLKLEMQKNNDTFKELTEEYIQDALHVENDFSPVENSMFNLKNSIEKNKSEIEMSLVRTKTYQEHPNVGPDTIDDLKYHSNDYKDEPILEPLVRMYKTIDKLGNVYKRKMHKIENVIKEVCGVEIADYTNLTQDFDGKLIGRVDTQDELSEKLANSRQAIKEMFNTDNSFDREIKVFLNNTLNEYEEYRTSDQVKICDAETERMFFKQSNNGTADNNKKGL